MTIEPIVGEALRYRVSSQSGPGHYIVDLSDNQGHGACSCKRWITTAHPRLVKGEPRFHQRTSCAHLRACWQHWLEHSLADAAAILHGTIHE